MIITKRSLLRLFFVAEIIGFVGVYFFSEHGVQKVRALQVENSTLQAQVADTQSEVLELERKILAYQSDSFYKEKVAREQLHMAKSQEKVYIL